MDGRSLSGVVGVLCDAAAVLLFAAGAAKLYRPSTAAATIAELLPGVLRRLPLRGLVRVGGGVEIAVAGYVLFVGDRLAAALLAACYLVFALVTLRLLATSSARDCGCFGKVTTPISGAHLALNAVCLALAGAAVLDPIGSLADRFAAGTAVGCGLVAESALLAWLGYLSIIALPELATARRRVEDPR